MARPVKKPGPDKFAGRFETMEQAFTARGRPWTEATVDELEAEWGRINADGGSRVRSRHDRR